MHTYLFRSGIQIHIVKYQLEQLHNWFVRMSQAKHPSLNEIPTERIIVGEYNVRASKEARKDLESLKESMKRRGLIQPIIVVSKDDKFELVVGQRRWLAARELGWKTIPAIIFDPMKVTEGRIYSAIENIHRKELSFKELSKACEYLFDEFKGDYNAVARELGISKQRAIDLLRNRLVPEDVAEMVDTKKIRKSDAIRATLAAYPNVEKIVEIAEAMPKLTTIERKRILDVATESPEAAPKELVEAAKKAPTEIEYRVVLLSKWAKGLENAARDRGEEPEETARIAIIDWLEAKGFV